MYNQSHQTGQNVYMNGGHGHQRYGMPMGAAKPFQANQPHHQPPQHAAHRQQQELGTHGHGTNYASHQHNASTSQYPGTNQHFNPNVARNGTPNHLQNGLSRPLTEHWQQQLALYRESQEATGTHPHARNHPSTKTIGGTASEATKGENEKATERYRPTGTDNEKHSWTELDLGGQGLHALALGLFSFRFLKKLYLNNNNLTVLSSAIGQLRSLTLLDLSKNKLNTLPAEVGMLVNLKSLLLFDNELESLPAELGSLYQLEMLGIEGNPDLDVGFRNTIMEENSKALITYLQESAEQPEPPDDRDWITVNESRNNTSSTQADTFKILTYNILCDKAATHAYYGYTPRSALTWDHRKELILEEIRGRDADILCLQEVDADTYHEFLRPALAHNGYKGVYWQRSRARTMTDKEAKTVDGCATFYKDSKYILLDKQNIDFAHTAINRPDMKLQHDVFNRVMPRDHIAVATFFENRQTGSRLIVANTHLFWDPAYTDVKVVQVAIMMEQLGKISETYARIPACKDKQLFKFSDRDSTNPDGVDKPADPLPEPGPSLEYAAGPQIPFVLCGDFNSVAGSGVCDLISNGSLPPNHPDIEGFKYGSFTRDGMSHPFSLKSAYTTKDLPFTNYTPGFEGMIDYIWYSTGSLQVTGLLGQIDKQYMQRVPGFPNWHYPSDHLALLAEFYVKAKKGVGAVGGAKA